MSVLEKLRKLSHNATRSVAKIPPDEKNMLIVTNLLVSAISGAEFNSEEDLALLLKNLLEQVSDIHETMNNCVESDENVMASTLLVCDIYEKTNVTNLSSLKKIIPAFQMLESKNFEMIIPDVSDLLRNLLATESASQDVQVTSDKAKLLSILCRLIPVLSSSYGEYVNIKNQIVTALDAISKGIDYLMQNSGGKQMGRTWMLTCIDVSVDLYILSIKQQLLKSKNGEISIEMMSEVKKIFANNLGYLVLSVRYMFPMIEANKNES
jgi:hypothetical protein